MDVLQIRNMGKELEKFLGEFDDWLQPQRAAGELADLRAGAVVGPASQERRADRP